MTYTSSDLYRELSGVIRDEAAAERLPITIDGILVAMASRHPLPLGADPDGFTAMCRDETIRKLLKTGRETATVGDWYLTAANLEMKACHVPSRSEVEVEERHTAVVEIVRRHLAAIHDEILAFDEHTLNIDWAGDRAEIVHQVLTELVPQLRGYGKGAREEIREKKALWGDDDDEEAVERAPLTVV